MCNCGKEGVKIEDEQMFVHDDDYSEWYQIVDAKFCPFCGYKLQPERLSEKAPKGEAIV